MVLTPSPFAENVTTDINDTSRSASARHETWQSANLCALFFHYQRSSAVKCIKHHQFYLFLMAFSKTNIFLPLRNLGVPN
jgi:hypothetical protein